MEIIGAANPENFEKYNLSFYLQDSVIKTAFLIKSGTEPIESGKLGDWETSSITDNTYILELRVTLTDGSEVVHLVEGIRVRNYTAIETSTPEPDTAPNELVPTQTLSSNENTFPTPDRSPPQEIAPNPAEISTDDIRDSLVRGAIIGTAGLALLIIYILFKNRD